MGKASYRERTQESTVARSSGGWWDMWAFPRAEGTRRGPMDAAKLEGRTLAALCQKPGGGGRNGGGSSRNQS